MGKTLVKFKGKRVSKREIDTEEKGLKVVEKEYKVGKVQLKEKVNE
jgi:hypothetical protein